MVKAQVECEGRQKYADLEILRAIAALMVLLSHAIGFGLVPFNPVLAMTGNYGLEAVMMFFVLSGAIITVSHPVRAPEERGSRFRTFIASRLIRIVPIYYMALGLALTTQCALGERIDPAQYAAHLGFVPSLTGFSIVATNPPLWSLPYEMSYYLLFGLCLVQPRLMALWAVAAFFCGLVAYPLLIEKPGFVPALVQIMAFSMPWLLGHWIARARLRAPAIPRSLGVAILAIGMTYSQLSIQDNFFDIFRLTAFALCCCPLVLSIVQDRHEESRAKNYLALRAVVGAGSVVMLWATADALISTKIFLSFTATVAAFIPLSFIEIGLRSIKLFVRPFVYIGSISYAMYAIHAPIMIGLRELNIGWPIRLIVFVGLVWLGSHLLERKIQPWIKALMPRPSPSTSGTVR